MHEDATTPPPAPNRPTPADGTPPPAPAPTGVPAGRASESATISETETADSIDGASAGSGPSESADVIVRDDGKVIDVAESEDNISLPALAPGTEATARRPRYEEFVRAVQGRKKILVLTHDNPDPDAMAGAIGVYEILTKKFGIETFIGHGGTISRAENKAMVKNLDLPIYSLGLLGDLQSFEGIILVDTQTEARYHSLPPAIVPVAVFDHHPPIGQKPVGVFVEIVPQAGATATIITQYMLAAGVEIRSAVATALMYGIRSDTGNFSRHAFQWDIEAHQALFPLIDAKRLAEIESPPLPREYFIELRNALGSAMIYGHAVVANMGRVENPDMIPLVADMLLRLDTATWAMAFGFFEREMRLSLRTSDENGDAGKVVRKILKKRGSGGGHGEMAAGQIPLTAAHVQVQFDIVQDDLVANFLQQIGEGEHGTPLCKPKKTGPALA